jgi:hypothetical protein
VNAVNRIYQQLSQFVDKQFVNNNFVVCVSLKIFRDIQCEISPNKVRYSHAFDYHRLSMDPKKPLPLDKNLKQRFFRVDNVLDQFKFSPLKRDLSKNRCQVGAITNSGFFDVWKYLTNLRALPSECEAKAAVRSSYR